MIPRESHDPKTSQSVPFQETKSIHFYIFFFLQLLHLVRICEGIVPIKGLLEPISLGGISGMHTVSKKFMRTKNRLLAQGDHFQVRLWMIHQISLLLAPLLNLCTEHLFILVPPPYNNPSHIHVSDILSLYYPNRGIQNGITGSNDELPNIPNRTFCDTPLGMLGPSSTPFQGNIRREFGAYQALWWHYSEGQYVCQPLWHLIHPFLLCFFVNYSLLAILQLDQFNRHRLRTRKSSWFTVEDGPTRCFL